jgi:hypothetical protein
MNKSLLDTDIYSEILRPVNVTVAVHAHTYRHAYGRLTLSVITVMEMVKGFQQVQRPQKIAPLSHPCRQRGFEKGDIPKYKRRLGNLGVLAVSAQFVASGPSPRAKTKL